MTTEELRESLLAAPKNGYSRITAEQKVEMESYFREKCDYVLENNGTQEDFQEKCLAFFRQFIIMK